MVYLVLIYALIYTLGEFVSRRIGLPHSVTFAGLAVFLAAALILYRRRYGLGACRRGRKRWPGLLLLLLWPAGDLVLAACGRSAAADGFFTCGMYVVCGMAEELAFRGYLWEHTQRLRPLTAGRAQRGRVRRVPRRQSHRRRTGRRRHTGGVRRLHGLRPVRDGRLLPLHRAGAGHPCAHQSLRRTFPRR